MRGVWLATVHSLTGLPAGLCTAVLAGCALPLSPVTVAPLRAVVRGATAMQRARFRALLGAEIPDVPGVRDATRRTTALWRQTAYHLLALPFGAAGAAVVTAAWSAGLAFAGLSFTFATGVRGTLLTAAGLALLVVAAALGRGVARLDAAVARRLLGPSPTEALAARLDELARSRSQAIEAADAERRRIERDLHDGTQQRLVSLALTLGMARAELPDGPARDAVGQAHEEAKATLAELRGFVRGLHPAVLDDRGLDAALSGLVVRLPQPVDLHVDVVPRCPAVIEAIAYFVVSESLTNIARHARATHVRVSVVRSRDRLRITVTDDGIGGAAARPGGGLHGLGQRAASVDGTLRVQSPPGGPTTVEVELPCGS
ncbi:sensor histidine kinase [Catenuloplanes atrovinosus]|uniref:histidine kinase n=1 Tax=Catenuloplanes atrovinosus TaxID=137266 RepID=A0AAE3YKP5_9ACTN|nr:histidine kinase [Catenuloplanes atrovinosus]MDR7274210.1 signal transduction histidine kinase [Catenuloplanes atrovinosus]